MPFAIVIGAILSIAMTVFFCIKILPAKYDGTFEKKPLQALHDYFNFKSLYLETVLKIIFVFLSVACVVIGLLGATIGNIIQLFINIGNAISYGYFGSWIWGQFFTLFFSGIGLAVLGPLVLRLVYESILMFILLVKNVIEINNKMNAPASENNTQETAAEDIPEVVEEETPISEEAPAAEIDAE